MSTWINRFSSRTDWGSEFYYFLTLFNATHCNFMPQSKCGPRYPFIFFESNSRCMLNRYRQTGDIITRMKMK